MKCEYISELYISKVDTLNPLTSPPPPLIRTCLGRQLMQVKVAFVVVASAPALLHEVQLAQASIHVTYVCVR